MGDRVGLATHPEKTGYPGRFSPKSPPEVLQGTQHAIPTHRIT